MRHTPSADVSQPLRLIRHSRAHEADERGRLIYSDANRDMHAKENQRPEQDRQDRRQNPADTAKVIEELVRGGDDQPDRYPDQRKRHQAPNHGLKSDMRY